jgi:hypothetical protein
MRVPSKGCLALWLVVSLMLAALIYADGARALGTNVPDVATETSTGEAPTESGAASEQEAPTTAEAPSAAEAAPPTTGQTSAGGEESSVAAGPAPSGGEESPVAAGPAPPVGEQTPPPKQAPPVAETAPPVEKTPVEQAPGGVTAEGGSEELVAQRTPESSQAPAGASGLPHTDAANEVAPEASFAGAAPAVTGAPSEASAMLDQPSLASSSEAVTARPTRQASCEIAAIGVSMVAADDADGWLGISAAALVSTGSFATVDGSLAARTVGGPGDSQDDGYVAENHPSAPTPGPGPGGAGGGAAAGGGSGSAASASFTLVGALLHAAPRAMRRFRLAQPSWRTSFFVLIPERPD